MKIYKPTTSHLLLYPFRAVVHFIYFLRIMQKLSTYCIQADKIEQLKSYFFCKRKIIYENIWANYFSPLTLSWSVSMKITVCSWYLSSMGLFSLIYTKPPGKYYFKSNCFVLFVRVKFRTWVRLTFVSFTD